MSSNQIPPNVRKIDRFEIKRELGSGSYGKVYQGSYEGNNYAIKEVSLSTPMNTLWEISLYNLMSHPNVAKPFEYIVDSKYENIYIVMPEAERNLATAVNTKLSESDARLYTWQLLSAMDYLHSNSIVHRDLKPANILLDDGQLYVIDFGLSRFLEQNVDPMSLYIQTYVYRAPEVFRAIEFPTQENLSRLGTPMDMWSVGIIMIEMFLGHRMFRTTSEESLSKHLLRFGSSVIHRNFVDVLPVSQDVKVLIKGLLDVDPEKRLTARQAMQSPWFSSFRYQAPELIRYPRVDVNLQGLTATRIIQEINPMVAKCRFNTRVIEQLLRYVKVIHRTNPMLLVNPDTRKKYYSILLSIAGLQFDEGRIGSLHECDLNPDRGNYNSKDIYDIFHALKFNIIIQ